MLLLSPFQMAQIAAHVLNRRRAQARNADFRKGIGEIERILFRIEHHRNALAGLRVGDGCFFEGYGQPKKFSQSVNLG